MRRILSPCFSLPAKQLILRAFLLALIVGSVTASASAQKVSFPATDFGDVKIGETKTIRKSICTVSAEECPDCDLNNLPVLTNFAITGPDASEFSTDFGNFLGQQVPPGQCVSFNVSFKPTRTGSHSAVLDVTSTHRQGGALYPLRAGCPIPPLQPITDPLAQSFEAGNEIDTSRLQPAMATAMSCLQNAVRSAGGNTSNFLSSAWRPSPYQAHLGEVYSKWQKLKDKTILGCEAVKSEVKQEIDKHGIVAKPASPTGRHTTGEAFDVNLNSLGISVSKVDELAKGCNLRRPFPTTDRVHFQLITGAPQSPLFDALSIDESPLTEAAADSVRVRVYQQNLGGRVYYRYSVINNSSQAIVGLRIGLAQIEADSELMDVPSGWNDVDGLPLNSAEAPAGWEPYMVTTEESNVVHIAWQVNQASVSIVPGQTRRGFSVVLPQAHDPYKTAHWTAILDDATTISGTLEPDTIPTSNPIDSSQTFVTQHYDDFLNRLPDSSGLAYWTSVANGCGNPDLLVCRINVSGAFFLSIEFKETGYLVERTYKASYGDAVGTSTLNGTHTLSVPVIRLREFMADTQRIGQGIVVLAPGWEQKLEANKTAFFQEFVQRPRFLNDFPLTMTPAQFVDQLNQRAGNPLDAAERQSLINQMTANNTTSGRAAVLRKVSEDPTLDAAEKNRAFVLMQYFGYLRRNPNEGQDTDYTGYDFWLGNLEKFGGNFVQAELVKAFIQSVEYKQRFGQ